MCKQSSLFPICKVTGILSKARLKRYDALRKVTEDERFTKDTAKSTQDALAEKRREAGALEESLARELERSFREGRIYVGFDCDDEGLGYSIQRAGREPFLFASDYPHESFSAQTCRREIDELLEREDLTDDDKAAVLAGNAKRFYGIAAA